MYNGKKTEGAQDWKLNFSTVIFRWVETDGEEQSVVIKKLLSIDDADFRAICLIDSKANNWKIHI